ncbi:hypothetical protein ACZ90_63640 [Streptomyces albus subsp. albus]|nr:hypothetical protein ACZ90_63640 [Streptomyces albus subsp. albus]
MAQLQDLLDEWITAGWQPRPHQGLRHPMMAKAALSPNEMWAGLIAASGYMPVPLTGGDYIELLPTRWQKITDRGIRISHRTYDHAILNPLRGQPSGVHTRSGKWEVHHNPHDARQVWVRLPDGHLAEIPWIHRGYVHQPFSDHLWQHLKTRVEQRGDGEQYETDLTEALNAILTRAHSGAGARSDTDAMPRAARRETGIPLWPAAPASISGCPDRPGDRGRVPCQAAEGVHGFEGPDSLEGLEETGDEDDDQDWTATAAAGGFGLYDAQREAEQW